MTEYISPITFTATYDKFSIQDYLEECEDNGATPTQEGFRKYVENAFDCMLEEYPKRSAFSMKEEDYAFVLETIYDEGDTVFNPK